MADGSRQVLMGTWYPELSGKEAIGCMVSTVGVTLKDRLS